jgi:site-specific recombinase XerD
MVEDMKIRNLSPNTIDAYTYHVDKFCQFFGKSAEELGPEEIRQYQVHLVDEKKVSWSSFNQAVRGPRFMYEVTLAKPWSSDTSPSENDPRLSPWFSPIRKPPGYSNVYIIPNIESSSSRAMRR